ncbi:MAG: undecaprenyldiphospho-muramoylpentapeptide beta-N-acetylglucosaminyltransferase [Sulfurospirillaceae bacterium]|nr:undecaprenyldiphospho-muramoylpentapeptide beta-N-acetylglucosaminyltransferase [Sulfurospirillaceae bacterium]MDD2827675.1 undecaprenyldiphospho-muramoylpentapeptide beta-N-acetylglucosaminyltransferase [Sulfurospirillaceae bacterium]
MIAITGGGTGGHLVIAKAIKEELNKRGIEPIYIGSTAGQDKGWFEKDEGFKQTYFLASQGVVNKKGYRKALALFSILSSALTCKAIFKQHNIHYVFSVGGYSAAPASIGALLFRIPLFIHEQNAIKGKLNALLKPFTKSFFSSYDMGSTYTNYPIQEAFFTTSRIRKNLKTIIFLGGSQGATFINKLAIQMAPELNKNGISIIHQTGHKELESVQAFYHSHHIDADVFAFSKEMPLKLANADFAISRSGASTLWELCAARLPALFVPFPYAAGNHQFFNAKILTDKGLGLLCEQASLNAPKILQDIYALDLAYISTNLAQTIQYGGAKEIVDIILKKN